ncbi:hypothetical protein [Microvirga pakistanensis]|uniref:hypothetical protein n=1 Tax=Microvirga pakistanensis TaxID=1682650 RepID=UPI00106A1621|nr:hypothetical protein [Microvirga pakistanensis]
MSLEGFNPLSNLSMKGFFGVVAMMEMEFDFTPSPGAELHEARELPFIELVPRIEEAMRRWAPLAVPVPCRDKRIFPKPLLKPLPRDVLSGLVNLRLEMISDRQEKMNRALSWRCRLAKRPPRSRTKGDVKHMKAIAPVHALDALTIRWRD